MKSKSPLKPVLLFSVLMMTSVLLASCQTTASVGTKSVACEAFQPIYWSKDDTLETAKQVRAHNAAWKSLCTS